MTTIFCSNEQMSLERTAETSDNETTFEQIWSEAELARCLRFISDGKFHKVCLQFPDDLLVYSTEIARQLKRQVEQDTTDIFILGDTSYGACCCDEIAAAHIEADALIHFGHACLSKVTRLPVLYVFPKHSIDLDHLVRSFEAQFPDREAKVALFYDVDWSWAVGALKERLAPYVSLVFGQLALDGQEPDRLCWSLGGRSLEDFVCVFVGRDNQSFFNISVGIKCVGWMLYEPSVPQLREMTLLDSRWMRRRYFYVEKVKDAQSIGIVVGTLTTKGYLTMVDHVKALTKQRGIRSYLISVGKVNPAKLANFAEIDAFVLIGCPENTLYTSRDFYKPLVSPFEIELALNPIWRAQIPETYCTDFKELLPNGRLHREAEEDEQNEREVDVSLVTGRIRVGKERESQGSSHTELQEYSRNQLAETSSADTFNERSWKGLDPQLGQDAPAEILQGRKGIPIRYDEQMEF